MRRRPPTPGFRDLVRSLRPVAYFPLRDAGPNAIDQMRRGDFVLSGSVSAYRRDSGACEAGTVGSVLFNAAGEFLLGSPASDHLNLTGSMTIIIGLKTTVTTDQHVLGFYNAGGPFNGFGLATGAGFGGSGGGDFAFWNGVAWANTSGLVNVTDGKWHLIGISMLGLVSHWWDNGVEVQTQGLASGPNSYTGTRAIGATSGSAGRFNGQLCDLAIFDRHLPASRMRQLHAAWRPGRG